jgi:MOSC domain-containing protein YiiM
LLNHGGLDKAVYGFSNNHFVHWQQHLGLSNIPYGKFGENLTISDLDEKQLAIGDRLQINDCILEVSQPRIPCYKISFEFGQIPMLNNFIDYGHTGVYFRVIQEGSIEAGSEVKLIYKHPENVTIYSLFKVHFDSKFPNQEQIMRQAVDMPELADNWRTKVKERLHLIDLYHQRQQSKK